MLAIHSEGASQEANSYDIVIKNGMILDGTGNPFFIADVGIRGEKIVESGVARHPEWPASNARPHTPGVSLCATV